MAWLSPKRFVARRMLTRYTNRMERMPQFVWSCMSDPWSRMCQSGSLISSMVTVSPSVTFVVKARYRYRYCRSSSLPSVSAACFPLGGNALQLVRQKQRSRAPSARRVNYLVVIHKCESCPALVATDNNRLTFNAQIAGRKYLPKKHNSSHLTRLQVSCLHFCELLFGNLRRVVGWETPEPHDSQHGNGGH